MYGVVKVLYCSLDRSCGRFSQILRTRLIYPGSTAGTWLFAQRRWLDAKDEEDYQTLTEVYAGKTFAPISTQLIAVACVWQGYHRLRERFPSAMRCSEDDFLQAVTAMKVPLCASHRSGSKAFRRNHRRSGGTTVVLRRTEIRRTSENHSAP